MRTLSKNSFWSFIWEKRMAAMAILLVIALVSGSIFAASSFNLILNAITNVRTSDAIEDLVSRVREGNPFAVADDDTDDSGCLHIFDEAWVGLECKVSDYNGEYAVGDEINLKIRFSKAVPNQVSTVVDGEWVTYQGTEKVFEKTFVPESDYLLIQVTDLQKYKTVGIESIEVTITQKAAVTQIPVHSRRSYTRRGHYLLYSGSYNGTYGTDDLWLSYCSDTDYLTLVYDCRSAEQTEWSVLGWGGALRGNWIGGPTYATSARSGTEEVTVQFSVKFLRNMMGLAAGDELTYMTLGAWNGGRIKSLTLHRGYQMESSPELYLGGEANESWRCSDIEQILDAPGDSYLYVRYTCTSASVPNAYVLGWGAGVNGEWISGRSYKIDGLAAGREYTAYMTVDEFRRSLGLSWDAKIDSVILSAYNNGKILAVWISPTLVDTGMGSGASSAGAQGLYVSYDSGSSGGSDSGNGILVGSGIFGEDGLLGSIFGGSGSLGGSVSSGGSGGSGGSGSTGGSSSSGGNGGSGGSSGSEFPAPPAGTTVVPGYKVNGASDAYDTLIGECTGWEYAYEQFLDPPRGYYDSDPYYEMKDYNAYTFDEGGFLIVDYVGDGIPRLTLGTSKQDPYYEKYGVYRPWKIVEPIYASDGKAVFSMESILRAIGGSGNITYIVEFWIILPHELDLDPNNEYYVRCMTKSEVEDILGEIADTPITTMGNRTLYEVMLSQYIDYEANIGKEMTVTLTFDKEVETELWFVFEKGGKGEYTGTLDEVAEYVYTWTGEIPAVDYMGVVVDKVLEGGDAQLLNINIGVKDKNKNDITTIGETPLTLPEGEWFKGDVTFSFSGSGASLDGVTVDIKINQDTVYRRTIQNGKVTLENVAFLKGVPGNGYYEIVAGAGGLSVTSATVTYKSKIGDPYTFIVNNRSQGSVGLATGLIEGQYSLKFKLSDIDGKALGDKKVKIQDEHGTALTKKDNGDELTNVWVDSEGRTTRSIELKNASQVWLVNYWDEDEYGTCKVVVISEYSCIPSSRASTTDAVSLISEDETDETVEAEWAFTSEQDVYVYPLEISEKADSVEATLCFIDAKGNAVEGIGVQGAAGYGEELGEYSDTVTDKKGCAILNVDLPQEEESAEAEESAAEETEESVAEDTADETETEESSRTVFLYISLTDMAGYDEILLESISAREISSLEEETEETEEDTEEETEEDSVLEEETEETPDQPELCVFTADNGSFTGLLSDYCGYEAGTDAKASVTFTFSNGSGETPDGAQAQINIGDVSFSGAIEGGKVTLGDVPLTEGITFNINITDMAEHEKIVLTGIELEILEEEDEEADAGEDLDQDIPEDVDSEIPEDESEEEESSEDGGQESDSGETDGDSEDVPEPDYVEEDAIVPDNGGDLSDDSEEGESDSSGESNGGELPPPPEADAVTMIEPVEVRDEEYS